MASVLVDTGEGTYEAVGLSRAPVDTSGSFQSLAGKFTLNASTTITSVKGRLSIFDNPGSSLTIGIGLVPGDMLYNGIYTVDGGSTMGWVGLDGLGWNLDAGDYWVTFNPNPGFSANMEGGAPHPLSDYAFESEYSGGQWQLMSSDIGLAFRIEGRGEGFLRMG